MGLICADSRGILAMILERVRPTLLPVVRAIVTILHNTTVWTENSTKDRENQDRKVLVVEDLKLLPVRGPAPVLAPALALELDLVPTQTPIINLQHRLTLRLHQEQPLPVVQVVNQVSRPI